MHHYGNDPDLQLEKYSSAITLSDMEIFVFPEIMYSLVLANIMSPRVWAWRDDPWFSKIDKMTPYRRILRLKQFIMDRYEFNLDLDTWGLTHKDREVARFKDHIDMEVLERSNALFGYEGDKYYFDLDIRKHFGLDTYTSDIIPYWKTETVEAMDAFQYRKGYHRGAGECVSLSTLYAAALFIVCGIPLEDIYLVATPLHSQNFVNVGEGILTNNRRVVSKNMWFNGTELTARSQRALRHEQVTIVANNTGHVHVMYPEATINKESYQVLQDKLSDFLVTDISMEILANFLREHSYLQKCFQLSAEKHGHVRYVPAEKVYACEHGSSFRVSDNTRDKLLDEIDEYEFYSAPVEGRILMNKFEAFFKTNPHLNLENEKDLQALLEEFSCTCAKAYDIGKGLLEFTRIQPRLPEIRQAVPSTPLALQTGMSREEVLAYVASMRVSHPVADLAFYAYRDMIHTDWAPFLKAALERNPVSAKATAGLSDKELIDTLEALPNESIYDGPRLAQPDEVWNFQRGDGVERALCLANIWKQRHPDETPILEITEHTAALEIGARRITWPSGKLLQQTLRL